jgi:hypothetical protein
MLIDGNSTLNPQVVYSGQEATAPTPEPEPTQAGYSFGGWYEDGAASAFDFATPITKTTLLQTRWTANTYSLVVNKDGESWLDHGKTFMLKLASDESQVFTADGTTFSFMPDGTYNLYDSESHQIQSNVSVTHNGSSTLDYYTVSFNLIGGNTSLSPQVVYSGQEATAPTVDSAPERVGYTFGWGEAGEETEIAFDFATPITKTTLLQTYWVPNTNTPYKVEHWVTYRYSNGSSMMDLDEEEELTGTTGTVVTANGKNTADRWHDPGDSRTIDSAILAGDGSTVLKLYYDAIMEETW